MPEQDHTAAIFESLGELKGITGQIRDSLAELKEAHAENSADIRVQGIELGTTQTRLTALEEDVARLQERAAARWRAHLTFIGMIASPLTVVGIYLADKVFH